MGVDVAVLFLENLPPLAWLSRVPSIRDSEAEAVYVAVGDGTAQSASKPFLALWSDGFVALPQFAQEVSQQSGLLCVCWKAEHGGVAGYSTYQKGGLIEEVTDDGPEYLLLPSRGLERTFDVALELTDGERLSFPDLVLKESVKTFQLHPGEAVLMEEGFITKLLEDDVDAEPVLPMTWEEED